MFWIQTENNLNNVIDVKSVFENCKSKGVTTIVIGNEGSMQWMEIIKESKNHDINVLYAIYKKTKGEKILWMLRGNIFDSASKLEKAYETGNFKKLNFDKAVPMILVCNKKKVDEIKKIYKKWYDITRNALILSTNETEQKYKEMKMKSESKTIHFQRVRFLDPFDKQASGIARTTLKNYAETSEYQSFIKPAKFLGEEYQRTNKSLKNINQDDALSPGGVMEIWDKKQIEDVKIPKTWHKLLGGKANLPKDKWELKKVLLLCNKAREGLLRKYSGETLKYVENKLMEELPVVINGGFYDYFLVLEDITRYAKNKGIRMGQRGSVVASYLAYCLDITKVDPYGHNLYFERFLNPHRSNKPDIDLEVPKDKMDKVIERIKKVYGPENVSKITSYNRKGIRNSVSEIRKKLGFKEKLEGFLPKIQDHDTFFESKDGEKFKSILQRRQAGKVFDLAKQIHKSPESVSIQQSAVVVSTGIPNIPTVIKDGERVIEFGVDNDSIEEMDMYKIDILSSRNLVTLEMMWSYLSEEEMVKFNHNDEKTYELLSRGDTEKVFQLSSYGMKNAFRDIKPKTLSEVADGIALYRPGPMDEIKKYSLNKRNSDPEKFLRDGKGKVIEGSELLYGIVERSHGIIIYQEQVLEILMQWAGYTIGEADLFREVMSKKRTVLLKDEKVKFFDKSKESNRSLVSTKQIYSLIEKFSEYGFPKSHAVSYAQLSYESAYMKANHPEIFILCNLKDPDTTNKEKKAILEEAKRMGVQVDPVDVNKSGFDYEIHQGKILSGLLSVPYLRLQDAEKIISNRNKGKININKLSLPKRAFQELNKINN